MHFNNREHVHKTVCGGIMSLLVRSLMLAYLIILTLRMINRDDVQSSSFSVQLQDGESNEVKMSELNSTIVFQFLNTTT